MTILEGLALLPEPYRSQAIENYDPVYISLWPDYASVSDSLEALNNAFSWSRSPQGDNYWRTFYDNPIVPYAKYLKSC